MTKALFKSLEEERNLFAQTLLQSNILQAHHMERFVALKLGAVEQIETLINHDSLIDFFKKHDLIGDIET